jgi:uncharacterized damage-inducible protein DinB
MTDNSRYPIGEWQSSKTIDFRTRRDLIHALAALPAQLAAAVSGLDDVQLDTRYRPEGWTARQVVHHIMDSHVNGYVRFKLGALETNPTIKPYDEKTWAETVDGRTAPILITLSVIAGVHQRWVLFLQSLQFSDFSRTIVHPERGTMTLDELLQLYAWHGRHHTAQVTVMRKRFGW